MMFENREEAGKLLAEKLIRFANDQSSVVLGITRGGVVVAKAIAEELNLPLDILVIKKISLTQEPELAIGAVGPKNTIYWYKNLCKRFDLKSLEMADLQREKQKEQIEQERILRGKRLPLNLEHKKVILVDDGVATGTSAICALLYLKKQRAKRTILATPMISKDILNPIKQYCDDVIFLELEDDFFSVGQFYQEFQQVTDREVKQILNSKLETANN